MLGYEKLRKTLDDLLPTVDSAKTKLGDLGTATGDLGTKATSVSDPWKVTMNGLAAAAEDMAGRVGGAVRDAMNWLNQLTGGSSGQAALTKNPDSYGYTLQLGTPSAGGSHPLTPNDLIPFADTMTGRTLYDIGWRLGPDGSAQKTGQTIFDKKDD